LRAHGWQAYQHRMVHDCELARYLHDLADAHPRLEATNEPELMIATFRYVPAEDRSSDDDDELNLRIMERLQYSGRIYPSNAYVDGRFVLRACIVNFRSEAQDIEALVDLTVEIGDDLAIG
jgi:glutamate/tyrosine decarboxylase-like PLP-dependent enzyme